MSVSDHLGDDCWTPETPMPYVEKCVAVGQHCNAAHSYSIALGEGAVTERERELCVKVGNIEMREVMTPAEFETIYALFQRMFKNNTIGPGGLDAKPRTATGRDE